MLKIVSKKDFQIASILEGNKTNYTKRLSLSE